MSLSERRRFSRFPFHSRGKLLVGMLEYSGVLMDISLSGGLFIIHAAPEFEVGKKCKLTIYYAEKTVFLTIDGCVVHCHDDLIGIEFVTDSKLLEQSLQHLVDLNLGSSTLLKRDMPALLG